MKNNDKKKTDKKNNDKKLAVKTEATDVMRNEAAFHEAGHAVAAVVLRVPIKHAVLTEHGDSHGHVLHDFEAVVRFSERVNNDDARRSEIERYIQVAVAGVVAAELAGEPGQGGESDEDGAQQLAARTCTHVAADHGAEVDAFLAWLKAATRNLLRRRWVAVENVAAALRRGEMLNARRIREIVDSAPEVDLLSRGVTVPESVLDEELTPEVLERLMREHEGKSSGRLNGRAADQGGKDNAAE